MKPKENSTKRTLSKTRVANFNSLQSAIANIAGKNRRTLLFSQLKPSEDYKNSCIMGEIEYCTEIKTRARNTTMRKCLLTDALDIHNTSDHRKLSVFLFNNMAANSSGAEVGSYMLIMDFFVENLTLNSNHVQGMTLLPFQVLVRNSSELCILKKRVREENLDNEVSEKNENAPHSDSFDFAEPSTSTGIRHSATSLKNRLPPKGLDQREQRKRKVQSSQAPSDIIDESEEFEVDEPSTSSSARKKKKQQISTGRNIPLRSRSSPPQSPPRLRAERSPPRNPKSPSKSYKYTRLNLLTATNDPKLNFNVFGVVEECSLKMNQKPHSSALSLVISDQTKKNFPVLVYVQSNETPPDVHPGDVIRLHRMMVENVRNSLKGKCLSAKSVLIFRLKDNGENPKSTAKTFTFTTADRIDAKNMFNWAEQRNWKFISDMRLGDFANILCQVISVYLPRTSDSVLLTVWDGTKNEELIMEERPGIVQNQDPSLMKIAKGYAVKIWVNGPYTLAAGELNPAQFIELRDVEMMCPRGIESSGNSTLVLRPPYKPNRGIFVVEDNDKRLDDLKVRLDGIIEENFQNPQSEDDISFLLNCGILDPQISSQESSKTSKKPPSQHKFLESDSSNDSTSTVPQNFNDENQFTENEIEVPNKNPRGFEGDETRVSTSPPLRVSDVTQQMKNLLEASTSTQIDENMDDMPLVTRVEVTGRKEPAFVVRKMPTAATVPKKVVPSTVQQEEALASQDIAMSQRIGLPVSDHSYSSAQSKSSAQSTSTTQRQTPQTIRQIADEDIVSILSASILPGQHTQGFGKTNEAFQQSTQQPEMTQPVLTQGQVISQFVSSQRQGVSQFVAQYPQPTTNVLSTTQLVGNLYPPTSQIVTQPSSQYVPTQPVLSQVPPSFSQYDPRSQFISSQVPPASQLMLNSQAMSQYLPMQSSQFLSQVLPSSQAVDSRYAPRTQFISSQVLPSSQLAATQQRVNLTQRDTFMGLSQLRPNTSQIPIFNFQTGNMQENLAEVAISSTKLHSNVGYSRISEVLAHDVPYKFRILATVLSFQPETSSIVKLIRLYCPKCHYLTIDALPKLPIQQTVNGLNVYHCPNCVNWSIASSSNNEGISQLHYTFLISFSMQDGMDSGTIDVFVWREDAVNLFKGITPEQALTEDRFVDAIFELLWKICPNSRPMGMGGDMYDNSPWMTYPVLECCIKSYTVGGSTKYQMFDTVLT